MDQPLGRPASKLAFGGGVDGVGDAEITVIGLAEDATGVGVLLVFAATATEVTGVSSVELWRDCGVGGVEVVRELLNVELSAVSPSSFYMKLN